MNDSRKGEAKLRGGLASYEYGHFVLHRESAERAELALFCPFAIHTAVFVCFVWI
jgi:hypothetical protein